LQITVSRTTRPTSSNFQ